MFHEWGLGSKVETIMVCSRLHHMRFFTRPRMGPSLGFVTDVFYFLCGALLHIMVCSIAPLDLYAPLEINCTTGVVLRHCFWILFEFQVIRKGCIFTRLSHWSGIAPFRPRYRPGIRNTRNFFFGIRNI